VRVAWDVRMAVGGRDVVGDEQDMKKKTKNK
jgi:hypothetical protein